jgi:hypothetical protein
MTPDIGLILGIDGIATGSIYVLVGLGLVLIFSVTRVVFVPFGDIVAFSALTLASMQLGRMPGTVYLVATLAIVACLVEGAHQWRRGQKRRIARGLLGYGLCHSSRPPSPGSPPEWFCPRGYKFRSPSRLSCRSGR